MEPKIIHEPEAGRFVVHLEEGEGVLSYREAGEDRLDFLRTWVPPAARNRGIGEALVLTGLDHARERGKRVIPSCPFVRTVAKRHSEYEPILLDDAPG